MHAKTKLYPINSLNSESQACDKSGIYFYIHPYVTPHHATRERDASQQRKFVSSGGGKIFLPRKQKIPRVGGGRGKRFQVMAEAQIALINVEVLVVSQKMGIFTTNFIRCYFSKK